MSTTAKYYPSLSTVVTLDDFPEYLGFIKDGIQQIFNDIYIKDFQAYISPIGESGFYALSIVSKKRLQFQIPGTEMFLKEHLFADIFERDVLSYVQRELVTVSVIAAIGDAEPMLKSHLTIAPLLTGHFVSIRKTLL